MGKFGEHTALEIYRNREKNVRQELIHSSGETPKLPDQISAWVSYIFNSGTVSVSSISESLKKIVISPDGSVNNYKPENVGYGFSYCLPIIVAGLVAREGDVIIIENPEAHLHPSAQNRITNFLCKVAASNVTTIIETHSPSILNGVRLAVKDGVLNN
ncbi:AAA family ATPase, partial [Vibrio anguillarum]